MNKTIEALNNSGLYQEPVSVTRNGVEYLVWLPVKSVLGIHRTDIIIKQVPTKPLDKVNEIYDSAYAEKYRAYEETETGRAINSLRNAMTYRELFTEADTVDVGIGYGTFIIDTDRKGWDVNPVAIAWLTATNMLFDPTKNKIKYATFWDSLEHIDDPKELLDNITDGVAMSIPYLVLNNQVPDNVDIDKLMDDLLQWKHHRVDEHLWYFIEIGIGDIDKFIYDDAIYYFLWSVYHGDFDDPNSGQLNNDETLFGREDILSYSFRRYKGG